MGRRGRRPVRRCSGRVNRRWAGRRGRRPLRRLSKTIRTLQRGPPGVAAPTAFIGGNPSPVTWAAVGSGPYGVNGTGLICRGRSVIQRSLPPCPLLRGGGSETGANCRNRSDNEPTFCPSYGGVARSAGVVPNPHPGSPSYAERARIPRPCGAAPFSEKGVREQKDALISFRCRIAC